MRGIEIRRTGPGEWTVRHDDDYEPWTVWGVYGSSSQAMSAALLLEGLDDLIVWRSSGE